MSPVKPPRTKHATQSASAHDQLSYLPIVFIVTVLLITSVITPTAVATVVVWIVRRRRRWDSQSCQGPCSSLAPHANITHTR